MPDGMEISCVIPAYQRLDLLTLCLACARAQRDVRLEIVVSDDSPDDKIGEVVREIAARDAFVRYLPGARSGNPVDNWNHGLDNATAPLRVLVHQDEHFLDPGYLARAVRAMNTSGAACSVARTSVTGVNRPSRFHLVSPIAGRLPRAEWFLPMINWIGPKAAFVFRGPHRFDRDMVQLADVEFYRRVLRTGSMVRVSGLCVGSVGHHRDSITARIDPAARALLDLDILAGRRPAEVGKVQHALARAIIGLRARVAR